MQTFLFLLELAGTVAFAVSGAVLGIEKHMDIFGVGLLGITTAVGGGILRDLVVGLTPPRAFQDPMYLLVALGVSVVLFFPFVRRLIGRSKRVFDALMLLMDATGLGIFTITGINTAITLADCTDPLLLVFVGLLTGTGGGHPAARPLRSCGGNPRHGRSLSLPQQGAGRLRRQPAGTDHLGRVPVGLTPHRPGQRLPDRG